MDPDTVFERATVSRRPGDLLPRGSDETKWIATDPETECRGVGDFEKAARTNLVYAVRAYHEDTESSVPFMSAGKDQTFEMHWLGTDDASLADRIHDLLSR
ncbi:hypothetical protein ACOZ4I_08950 [Haloarcula salina]|uniref:hypothetical protein n=1 Tax=Haloarcula salina TaxID=1429914 RepID=UPI003C6F2127